MNTEDLIRKSIIADMSEGVMTVGFDGVISHANPAAEVILGMKTEELVGKSFASILRYLMLSFIMSLYIVTVSVTCLLTCCF